MGFPDRLRALRERRKPVVSVEKTSSLMGLGANTLRRYESGQHKPGLEELKKIASYYEISLDDFCWDDGEKHPNI